MFLVKSWYIQNAINGHIYFLFIQRKKKGIKCVYKIYIYAFTSNDSNYEQISIPANGLL